MDANADLNIKRASYGFDVATRGGAAQQDWEEF